MANIAPPVITFILSLLLPLAVRPCLTRAGTLDVPVARSAHNVPVLRGGGLAPALALVVGLVVVALTAAPVTASPLVGMGMGVVAAAALGLAEDVRGVAIKQRAAGQLIIGSVASVLVVVSIGAPWWLVLLGALGVAGYINIANFMDGIDGISSIHGLVVGAVYAVVSAVTGHEAIVATSLCLSGAFIAFLPWNIAGRKMFLGDIGSYALGSAISLLALWMITVGVSPLCVLAPVALYLADTGVTLVRRALRGERWYESHSSHIYQRFGQRFGHLRTALVVGALSLFCGLAGLVSLNGSVVAALGVAALIIVVAVGWVVYASVRVESAPRVAGSIR